MKFAIFIMLLSLITACDKGEQKAAAPQNASASAPSVTEKNASSTTTPASDELDTPEKVLDPSEIPTPMESIKKLDVKVENYHLGTNLTAEQIDDNMRLKREIIRGTFDIKELCRLSLGSHWDTLNEDQRKHFVGLMTKLLEKKAILSKEQVKGNKPYTIKYLTEKYDDSQKKKSVVTSKLFVPKDRMDFDLTYKLLLTPYGWKIYDVIVDDASLLTNYKFQFDKIIQKNGFDDLIKRMETKLDTMK